MNDYKIFQHPSGELEAVKQGFSWPAFLFGIFWALVKKLWMVAAGLAILGIATRIVFFFMGNRLDVDILLIMVSFFTIAALGEYGNLFREKNLVSRGCTEAGLVTGGSSNDAVAVYLKQKGHDAASSEKA